MRDWRNLTKLEVIHEIENGICFICNVCDTCLLYLTCTNLVEFWHEGGCGIAQFYCMKCIFQTTKLQIELLLCCFLCFFSWLLDRLLRFVCCVVCFFFSFGYANVYIWALFWFTFIYKNVFSVIENVLSVRK